MECKEEKDFTIYDDLYRNNFAINNVFDAPISQLYYDALYEYSKNCGKYSNEFVRLFDVRISEHLPLALVVNKNPDGIIHYIVICFNNKNIIFFIKSKETNMITNNGAYIFSSDNCNGFPNNCNLFCNCKDTITKIINEVEYLMYL